MYLEVTVCVFVVYLPHILILCVPLLPNVVIQIFSSNYFCCCCCFVFTCFCFIFSFESPWAVFFTRNRDIIPKHIELRSASVEVKIALAIMVDLKAQLKLIVCVCLSVCSNGGISDSQDKHLKSKKNAHKKIIFASCWWKSIASHNNMWHESGKNCDQLRKWV